MAIVKLLLAKQWSDNITLIKAFMFYLICHFVFQILLEIPGCVAI